MRLVVFRDNDAAARFLVETMHDTGPLFSANAGKIRAMMQERVYQGVFTLIPAKFSWLRMLLSTVSDPTYPGSNLPNFSR